MVRQSEYKGVARNWQTLEAAKCLGRNETNEGGAW
jgi:hypothetical protein